MKAGWNQIGNPFDSDLSWNDVLIWPGGSEPALPLAQAVSLGLIKNGLWNCINGDYNLSATLEAGLGYWVRASRDLNIIFPRPGSIAASLAAAPGCDWQVKVSLTTARGGKDTGDSFGAATAAADQADNSFDIAKPPAFSGEPALYFIEGDEKLAVDIKQTTDGAKSWQLAVCNGPDDDLMTLDFTGLPAGTACNFIDLIDHSQVDLGRSPTVSFRLRGNETRLFKIETAGIHASGPLALLDTINYPNPFDPLNTSTGIRFDLTRDADINIKIFDVGGGLVRALARPGCGAGINTVAWDGRDASGRIAANGVYFYLITARDSAGDQAQQKGKMAVWK